MKFLGTMEVDFEFPAFGVVDTVLDDVTKVMVGKFGIINCYFGMTSMNDECLSPKSEGYALGKRESTS